jgi:NDP-sugar pyrophosphorylase family protein
MPRGAAGAVRDAGTASDAELFVVADGTAIPNVKLDDLLTTHRNSGAAVTVVVHNERRHSGSEQVPTGIYVFNREALEVVPLTGFYDIKETLIPQLHRMGLPVRAYRIAQQGPRVLDASSYLALNEWIVEHLAHAEVPPADYVKRGTALIHRDADVAEGATLVGAVLVGPGASVMAGAVVVGPASIGRDATIEAGALVSRSAIWRRCHLEENAVADRCIMGDDTVLTAGTQAFRQVRTGRLRQHGNLVREDRARQEVFAGELLRRMGRTLFGATWSRYPAAQ